jgi:hypothetical protein
MFKKHSSLAIRCACGILVFSAASVLAVDPRVASITPAGSQRGTNVELTLRGDRLQDAAELIAYEPGIEITKLSSVTNKMLKAEAKIAPDCPLGEHHFRLRTASGLSELRTFFVGAFPVVSEVEPNNTPAQAQKIALNTTVAGVITSEDVDCFAVNAKKGERLSAEVQGMRLGRGVFDPHISVLDTNGVSLAEVGDTWLAMQDPFVSLVAPHDGTFIIQVREAIYGGSADCHYLLHVGNFPRPNSIFPPGGKVGETVPFAFYSEATGEFHQDLKLPDTVQEKFGVFAEMDQLPSPSPNWIRVSPFANFLSPGSTSDREHAADVNLHPPFALNGIIAREKQEDWFRFPAKKGVALDVNVYARQLRSPLDSVIDVYDAKGKKLASNDDAGGADSSLKFTPGDTTNYFVRIRDTLGHFGPDFTYRIEVTPVAPEVTVKIPEVARNDSQARQVIAVPRGNRFATLISAKRANFNGGLSFDLPGLPSGVTMAADALPSGVDSEPLVFEAASDAPLGTQLLDLTASGTNADGTVAGHFRQEAELVEGPNNTIYYGTRVDKFCVAVVKEAPFRLRIIEPDVPLVQSGSMGLQVVAERDAGFDEPIELQMVWNPPGITSQTDVTIAKGATNKNYTLNASDNAQARAWKIAVIGHATVDGGQLYVSSQLCPVEVTSPFLSGKIQTLVTSPGQTAKLNVDLKQLKPFEGSAEIRLFGLPDRVTASKREITKDDQKVTFDLNIGTNCLPGSFKNLFCAVDVPNEGKSISHNIASGGILRVVPPKKAPVKLAQAKEGNP